jgi:hypothetical protein
VNTHSEHHAPSQIVLSRQVALISQGCNFQVSVCDFMTCRGLKDTELMLWRKYIDFLLQVCLQVAEVVSPVVQNSSPEGNVPEEAVLGTFF